MTDLPGRPPLTPEAAQLVKVMRQLAEVADGMHSAERREYGELLPCGKGRICHTCETIARARVALTTFLAGRREP
jgi:hypothetical protein